MRPANLVSIFLILILTLPLTGAGTDNSKNSIKIQIDHFVVGISELEKGINQFNGLTGVKPVHGGKHPFFGTHNALVTLGDKLYLEILAPLPGMDTGLYSQLNQLTPLSFAVSTDNIVWLKKKLNKLGYKTTGLIPGSRTTPNGEKLEWSAFMIIKPAIKGVPFFIQWKGRSIHPSKTSPRGCTLFSFELNTPTPDLLKSLLTELSLTIKVNKSSTLGLRIELNSPKGKVEFSK